MRAHPLLLAGILVLAGCVSAEPDSVDETGGLEIDTNRPAPSFGDVVTGPAVGPDLNATTDAAPRLVEGEWWRIRFNSEFEGLPVEVVRVVANVSDTGYVFGMPHEGWFKEAIAYHAPAFGDVNFDLSYNTHNKLFQPVKFPIKMGDKWQTIFAETKYEATVESADYQTATIRLTPIRNNPQPTDPITDRLGITGDGGAITIIYDARIHEVVRMESLIGSWDVVEHGYDFQGWVTVPRGEHTAIDYGTFGPVTPGQPVINRAVRVEGGFNRMTLMHLLIALTPGQYRIVSKPPEEAAMRTEMTGTAPFTIRFYESSKPDGVWNQEDWVIGGGATYTMGIAYHQYDIRLPDGTRRADHHHPVIR